MKKLMPTVTAILLVFGALVLYALTIRGVNYNIEVSQIKNNLDQGTKPLELSPERGRFILTMSLVKNRSFALSEDMANAVYPDVGWYDGRFFILFAPGISLMAAPLYILGSYFNLSQVFSFYLISLFATANGIVIFQIAKKIFKLPVWASFTAALAFCFGSTAWAYAVTLYQHHVTTFFVLSGFLSVWKYRQGGKNSWIFAAYTWLMYALAIGIDYPNMLTYLPIMIYLGLSSISVKSTEKNLNFSFRPALLFTSIVFILVSLVHGYYNQVHFGKWSKLSGGLIDYKKIVDNNLLQDQAGAAQIKEIESKINPSKYFSEEDFPFGLHTLLTSDDRGLLLYSPLFVIGLLGLIPYLKKPTLEIAILVTCVLTTIFLYSSWSDPWGGWAFGPRYMIPVYAISSIFVASWAKSSLPKKIITYLLFIYSSGVGLLGALTTNGVPPTLDAKLINVPHNYLYNIEFLLKNKSSSYIYNYFASPYMDLVQYYSLILGLVLVIGFVAMFVIPLYQKNDH